jgi:murein DD-endopeptidase MepM/ murein hydrolase activator NlpD
MWRLVCAAWLVSAFPPWSTALQQPAPDLMYQFPVQPHEKATFGKGGHAYPAIDIFAPEGSAFVAPTSGVIEEVQRNDRWSRETDDPALKGGRWVSLIGDDGIRYYGSHLLRVEPGLAAGQRVQAGARLGEVGRSGNARRTPAHLHFGISRGQRPYSWQVRRGEIDPHPLLKCMLRKTCNPRVILQSMEPSTRFHK